MDISDQSPHLNATLRGLAHRQEVTDYVRNQVGAHFHSGVKVILEQAARQLHRFDLRSRNEEVLHQSQGLRLRSKQTQTSRNMSRMHAYLGHVGNGYVARFPYNLYGEFGFKSWFVKTGEGCTSKGGFKLGRCQDPKERQINAAISLFDIRESSLRCLDESVSPDIPAAGAVAAFVEAMEAIRKVGSKPQQNLVRPASGQQGV